ncbi:MAG: crotonase/enoyl-CoA hydratase family protein [Desulfobacterales bacterium]|nr:crotonase/enoyl-CoA hydratase family protein [Desulfobacterales bacterium]MBS3755178.1 crotonase/enoyl-CoA hydratase family protein [Desulfobacterales bacterium]
MSAYQFYEVVKQPPVAWVYLNRPDKKNAMNPPAWKESIPIFEDLDRDKEIRAVVISGRGPCFSAGIDLMGMAGELPELMESGQTGGIKWDLLKKIYAMQNAISCIEWCRKPVIAAIHGHCIGAGLDMATACDFRICSQDAVFCLKEAAVGFVADVGVLQRIPQIVGQGYARELAYTAKEFDAQKAGRMLLVNDIFTDYEALMAGAQALAGQIAENPPLAVQASKDVLNYGVGKTVDEGLKYVGSVSANIIPSKDLMEAIAAFSEKRKPVFTGE